jgi:very-short-patch-repair endonuclease
MPKIIRVPRKKKEQPKWFRTPAKPTKVVSQKQMDKTALAKKMRENPTPTEKMMADLLTEHGISFKTQVVMLGYIADFYFRRAKSILEVDGLIHGKRKEYDELRDEHFREAGFRVLRIYADRLIKEPGKVIAEVKAYLQHGKAKKRVKRNIAKKSKKANRWQDVPKLSKNHLPI